MCRAVDLFLFLYFEIRPRKKTKTMFTFLFRRKRKVEANDVFCVFSFVVIFFSCEVTKAQ